MHLSKHHLAIIALVIANFIWGAGSPIFKWSLESIPPFTLAFLRFFIASFLLLPFIIHKLHINKKDIFTLILLSLVGITANISLFFLGLQKTASINVPIIASSGPVFIILGSIFFLHEKQSRKIITGTIMSLIGVLVIVLQPLLRGEADGEIFGNFLIVLSMLSGVIHLLILRKLIKNYDCMTLTFWSFVIGSIGFLPFLFLEINTHGPFLNNLTNQGLIGIIYGAILSSALAYYLFSLAAKYMNATEVGLFVYLDPIIAICVAIPLLGEKITLPFIIGSILVFAGIFIAEGRINYHPFHKFKAKNI